VECIVNQDDLHRDMIARKQSVRTRYMQLHQQLEELHQLKEQISVYGLNHIQQYVRSVLTTASGLLTSFWAGESISWENEAPCFIEI